MGNAVKKRVLSEQTQIALSYLLTKQTFFSHLLYDQMVLEEAEVIELPDGSGQQDNPTAATDGKTVWVNPKWFDTLRPPERAFVLAHEVMHAIWLHQPRAKLYRQLNRGPDGQPWDAERWNKAGDYVINAALKEVKGLEMPQIGLYDSKFKAGDMIDHIYRDLPPSPPQNGKGGGGGAGGGQSMDQHIEPKNMSSQGEEANMERAVKQAAAAAKSRGDLPGCMSDLIDELVEPTVPWRDMLRTEMMIHSDADENDWNNPNRRRLVADPPIIMPRQRGTSSGELCIEIDTSGSVSTKEIASMLSETKAICDETHPEMVTILWVDAKVQEVDYVEFPDDFDDVIERILKDGAPGRGGTDMVEAFRWIKEQGVEPDHMIVFTDMYTPFPDENDVPYPVTWCSTTKGMEAPFGQLIFVDPNSHDE